MEKEASSDKVKGVSRKDSVKSDGFDILIFAAKSVAYRKSSAAAAAINREETTPQGKKWKKVFK